MTQYTILGRLRLMTELDDEGARNALPFCAAAMEQLLPRLRKGCQKDPRLDRAAAAQALCMMLMRGESENGDGIENFKVGDISVTRSGKAVQERMAWARQELAEAMEDIAELLRDSGFGVRTAKIH